jgi:hypothetical protein
MDTLRHGGRAEKGRHTAGYMEDSPYVYQVIAQWVWVCGNPLVVVSGHDVRRGPSLSTSVNSMIVSAGSLPDPNLNIRRIVWSV